MVWFKISKTKAVCFWLSSGFRKQNPFVFGLVLVLKKLNPFAFALVVFKKTKLICFWLSSELKKKHDLFLVQFKIFKKFHSSQPLFPIILNELIQFAEKGQTHQLQKEKYEITLFFGL